MVFDFRNLLSLSLFGRKDESIHEGTQFAYIGEGCRGKTASTECVACVAKKKRREKKGVETSPMIQTKRAKSQRTRELANYD